jgi:hypothetical protein
MEVQILSSELLNAIEAGCADVTPGPWRNDNGEGYSINSIWAPKRILVAQAVGDSAEADANAAHIARLDPATVRELVAGYRAGLEPVKIKPLKWHFFNLPHDYGKGSWEAYGVGRKYEILDLDEDRYDKDKGFRFYLRGIGQYSTKEDAMAAAQADYEANIRFALEVPHV